MRSYNANLSAAASIIMLLGIPVLFYFFQGKNQTLLENQITEKPLPFILMDDAEAGQMSRFTSSLLPAMLRGKKRTDVYLENHNFAYIRLNDSAVRAFILREMERLAFSYQPKEVLIVHLNEECTIGDWVNLIKMAQNVGLKRYTYWNDEFYFIGNYIDQ